MKKDVLKVDGMSCQHCVNSITKALAAIKVKADVNLENKSVAVEYDNSKVSLDDIKNAIEDQGYTVV